MKVISKVLVLILLWGGVNFAADDNITDDAFITYRGMSDASAAVAVGEDMFVVADDENNVLRIYKIGHGSGPISFYDLTEFLAIEPEHPEADIEGATRIDDRIYWITSHGRNQDGKLRPNRYRFFATTVKVKNAGVTITGFGKPCQTLIHNLVKTEPMRRLGLDRATCFDTIKIKTKERKKLAPKDEGLNIEGLCASPDGGTIYIGFRNPRPVIPGTTTAAALVAPLKNPGEVIEKGSRPIFGEALLWDLGGLGIRGMEYSPFHKTYFIVAGAYNEKSGFVLYRWSGKKNKPPVMVRKIKTQASDFTPESLITFESLASIFLFSDDGSIIIDVKDARECMEGELRKDGKCLNKHLLNQDNKYFRGLWLLP